MTCREGTHCWHEAKPPEWMAVGLGDVAESCCSCGRWHQVHATRANRARRTRTWIEHKSYRETCGMGGRVLLGEWSSSG